MPSNRKEFAYRIVQVKQSEKLQATVINNVNRFLAEYGPDDRALVFCRSHSDTKEIANALGVQPYFAGAEDQIIKDFISGKQKVLPTTTALGAGFHYDSIRHVIHYKFGYSILDHYQEDSRGGRDGKRCDAITYEYENTFRGLPEDEYDIGRCALKEWATQTGRCLRIIPSCFLDGVAVTCTLLKDAEKCSYCEQEENSDPPAILSLLPVKPHLISSPRTLPSASQNVPPTRPIISDSSNVPVQFSSMNNRTIPNLFPSTVSSLVKTPVQNVFSRLPTPAMSSPPLPLP